MNYPFTVFTSKNLKNSFGFETLLSLDRRKHISSSRDMHTRVNFREHGCYADSYAYALLCGLPDARKAREKAVRSIENKLSLRKLDSLCDVLKRCERTVLEWVHRVSPEEAIELLRRTPIFDPLKDETLFFEAPPEPGEEEEQEATEDIPRCRFCNSEISEEDALMMSIFRKPCPICGQKEPERETPRKLREWLEEVK